MQDNKDFNSTKINYNTHASTNFKFVISSPAFSDINYDILFSFQENLYSEYYLCLAIYIIYIIKFTDYCY